MTWTSVVSAKPTSANHALRTSTTAPSVKLALE